MPVQLDRTRDPRRPTGSGGLRQWPAGPPAPEAVSRRELRRREREQQHRTHQRRAPATPEQLPHPRERRPVPAPVPVPVPAQPAGRPAAPARRRSRFRTRALPLLAAIGVVIGIYGGAAGGQRLAALRDGAVGRPLPAAPAGAGSAEDSGPGGATATPAASTPASMPSSTVAPTAAALAPAGSVAAPGTVLAPVYWVTASSTRSLVAREYLQLPDRGGALLSALHAILEQHPLDPDYTSPWRPAASVGVHATATGITVDLSSDAFAATGVRSETGVAGIQQLVWTVTAVAHQDVPVTILVDGRSGYQAWNAITLSAPVRRQAAARAAVWIDTPEQTVRVSSPVHITGQGSAAGNAFHWKVTSGTRVVASGTVTGTSAGEAPGWSQFAVDVALPAGSYELAVEAGRTGQQGMPADWQWPDTKSFTVG